MKKRIVVTFVMIIVLVFSFAIIASGARATKEVIKRNDHKDDSSFARACMALENPDFEKRYDKKQLEDREKELIEKMNALEQKSWFKFGEIRVRKSKKDIIKCIRKIEE